MATVFAQHPLRRQSPVLARLEKDVAEFGADGRYSLSALFAPQRFQVVSAFADEVSATAASEVSSRNVKVSCR
jgi:hypothetical protein